MMSNSKKNLLFAAIFSALVLISALIYIIHLNTASAAKEAKILQNGAVIKTVDLANVTEPYEFSITNDVGGENIIRVEKGKIAVKEANCPDKICVGRGFIENSALPIVCLPNKLTILITNGESGTDAVSGGGGR